MYQSPTQSYMSTATNSGTKTQYERVGKLSEKLNNLGKVLDLTKLSIF